MGLISKTRFSLFVKSGKSLCTSFSQFSRLPKKPDIVFIWIPKTAGTSVYESLHQSIRLQKIKKPKEFLSFPGFGPVTFGHVSYQSLLALGCVDRDYHNRAFKFCFVRNPYARIASLYNYLMGIGRLSKNLDFDNFLYSVYLYREPIGLYNSLGISQTNPQSDWVVGEKQQFLVDKIFKVEELGEFKEFFNERYGVHFNTKKQSNVSTQLVNMNDIYNDKNRMNKIELIYARDFDLFGYKRMSS